MAETTRPAAPAARIARRVPDRALLIALGVALTLLVLTTAIGLVATRNPTPPPLSLPTASSR